MRDRAGRTHAPDEVAAVPLGLREAREDKIDGVDSFIDSGTAVDGDVPSGLSNRMPASWAPSGMIIRDP